MSIKVNNKVFTLQTENSTYQMKVTEHGHLLHLYYGSKIADEDVSYIIPQVMRSHESNPPEVGEDRIYSLAAYPQEFSTNDVGDYRIPSIELINHDGSYSKCDFSIDNNGKITVNTPAEILNPVLLIIKLT